MNLKQIKLSLLCFFVILSFSLLTQEAASAASVGSTTKVEQEDDNTFLVTTTTDLIKLTFNREDMLRIQLAVNGQFPTLKGRNNSPNAAMEPIVIQDDFGPVNVALSDNEQYYKFETDEFVLRAYKSPLKFAMYQKDNETLVWEEEAALSYNTTSVTQKLVRGEDEYFYGGGMQNGYFNHRDRKISIAANYGDWGDGTVSNPAPFYLSTQGYGVLRNTFQKGTYDFDSTVSLVHEDRAFDAYYFYGETIEDILEGYTDLTGKPTLIPRWGMGFGEANCFNRAPGTTLDVVNLVAKQYRDNDMPAAWILPNDGYGCGYTNLEQTVEELHDYNFYTGLWTENGVANIAHEVGVAGTRLAKLDVAWVGHGYDFALNASKQAFEGIENNSDSRGFVWSVGGWAGTQRYSTVWSGDQYGNWEYIRFHIPSMIGAGLSGIPYATGDIDGIFGGSAKTYVRDLQWKVFTPTLIAMSGWASKDKQPWVWGEPYTSYNRDMLKLREQLNPYFYTYLAKAYDTGAPLVRGMIYEYPNDPNSKGVLTQYQFMSGEYFLVAPVYQDSNIRNGIYLPKGKWIDYWTGEAHYGSKMLDEYNAPLETLPLLVKAGAIIPMYPESLYDGEVPPNPITYDIYPYKTSNFTMYEDDGNTKEHRSGKFATTTITSIAPETGTGQLMIQVGASIGDYTGKLQERVNQFTIHMTNAPSSVKVDNVAYTQYSSKEDLDTANSGWYYDAANRQGVLHIKTPEISTSQAFEVQIAGFIADETPLTDAVKIEIPQLDSDPNLIPQKDMLVRATSVQDTNVAQLATDGNYETIWSSSLSSSLPQSITLNLGYSQNINKLKYLPKQYGNTDGSITEYNIYVSLDDVAYTLVSSGEWTASKSEKSVTFNTVEAKYIRLEATAAVGGFASVAEINVYRDPLVPSLTPIAKSEMSAYAPSFQPGAEASKAIDGDMSSVWHTKWDGSDVLPQYIQLDLGKVHSISQFRYIPRSDAGNGTISGYNLYVSVDGVNFTRIANGTWAINNEHKYVTFAPVDARYVKLEAVAARGGFVSATELDVYTMPKVAEIGLISENKPATASSEATNFPASAGNDGDMNTGWAAADTNVNHSWIVDLQGQFSIQKAEVAFEQSDKAYRYKIEVRESPSSNWITVVDRTNNTTASEWLTDNFGSRGQFVKITITGLPDSNTRAGFKEFKVHGIEIIESINPESITITPTTLNLNVMDEPVELTTIFEPANTTERQLTWSSSNPGVASVDETGIVTPKGEGVAVITARTVVGGFTAEVSVTVTGQENLNEIPQSQMTATADSAQVGANDPYMAIDNNVNTHWHTRWFNLDPLPQSIVLQLGDTYNVSQMKYLPRPDAGNGTITAYNIYTSLDGVNYTLVTSGEWLRNNVWKEANFAPVEAAYIKLEATAGSGNFASAAELKVYYSDEEIPSPSAKAQFMFNSPVTAEEEFEVVLALKNLTDHAYAVDFTLQYDSTVLDYVSSESIASGVQLVTSEQSLEDRIRFILASSGINHSITGDIDLIKFVFEANPTNKIVEGEIELKELILGNAIGEELSIDPSSISITVQPKNVVMDPDLNGDGKITIGDLALLAVHYGYDHTHEDWESIKRFDLEPDGVIDILDLVLLAQKLMDR
jgi:alpha-glucosidase (family GH31 glycosyl hydrolase)